MSEERQPRPFEPPPWEKEAFERFYAERAAREAASRRAVRTDEAAGPPEEGAPERREAHEAAGPQPGGVPAAASRRGVSEAEVESMLFELRAEEPPAARTNQTLIDVVSGLLAVAGIALIVQAAVLFGRTRATGAAAMIGATASLLVLLTGVGFTVGAGLLFRKYHR